MLSGVAENRSTTFRVAAVETGHAAIEKNDSLGLAFTAQSGFGGKTSGRTVLRIKLISGFIFLAFVIDQFLLMIVEIIFLDHADHFHVCFDRISYLSNQ